MTLPRVFAVLLIAVEAAALAATTTVVVPVVVTAVAMLGLFIRFRFALGLRAGLWLTLGGGLLLQARFVVLPGLLSANSPLLEFHGARDIGCYLLAVQTAIVFAKLKSNHAFIWLAGLGIIVMLCAGMQPAVSARDSAFRVLAVGFVAVSAALFSAVRDRRTVGANGSLLWRKRVIAGALLTAVVLASWTTAGVIDNLLDKFWTAVVPAARTQMTGFSGSGDLSAISFIRVTESDKVQLSVICNHRPGYLRGKVFDTFEDSNWECYSNSRELNPLPNWPSNTSGSRQDGNLFGRTEPASLNWQREIVCQPAQSEEFVFTPLGTTHLVAHFETVEMDWYNVFTTYDSSEGTPYRALVPRGVPGELFISRRAELLRRVPQQYWNELEQLAATIFAGCTTAQEKITAIEQHFRKNYQYQLEQDWPTDLDDPLLYFLRQRPPAHCEFFATGAAVLLRMVGVPSRYVTGYVVTEEDTKLGKWIARGKHAHAWVEAYDADRGWVVVEATPDAGVPSTREFNQVAAQPNSLLSGFLDNLTWTWFLWPICTVGAGVVVLFVIRKARRQREPRRRDEWLQHDSMFSALHGLLVQMDRYVRRFDLKRDRSETLHEFSQRIRQRAVFEPQLAAAAKWYPVYASCRYAGDIDDQTIAVLSLQLQEAQGS